jgi:hypothetical protein
MHTNFIHTKTKSRNLISEATAARHKPARTFKRKSHWNFASRTFVNTKQGRVIKNKKYLTLLNCCCHTRGWRRILCLISWWNQFPEDEFFLTAVSYLCKLFPSLWIRNIHVSVLYFVTCSSQRRGIIRGNFKNKDNRLSDVQDWYSIYMQLALYRDTN